MTAEDPGPFTLDLSDTVKQQGASVLAAAKARGIAPRMREAARSIIKKLQTDPISVGEPQYELKHAKLTMCLVVDGPLAVEFAIHAETRVVFICSFVATSG